MQDSMNNPTFLGLLMAAIFLRQSTEKRRKLSWMWALAQVDLKQVQ
jgi:hypothetical protein